MDNKFKKNELHLFEKNSIIDPQQQRTYWRRLMNSTQLQMSRGAHHVFKIISWARRENWRRPKK